MTKDEAVQLAKLKMGTPVLCSLCGEPYVLMDLRTPSRICSRKKCQDAYRSAPLTVNKDRQFLNPKEIDIIKSNAEQVTMRGSFKDVRGNQQTQ